MMSAPEVPSIKIVSKSAPPSNVSFPAPPTIVSSPAFPMIVSSPAPPCRKSSPAPPIRIASALRKSSPGSPSRVIGNALLRLRQLLEIVVAGLTVNVHDVVVAARLPISTSTEPLHGHRATLDSDIDVVIACGAVDLDVVVAIVSRTSTLQRPSRPDRCPG